MTVSDREVRSVLRFYVWLRKIALVAGVAVIVAAGVAVIALVYNIGLKNGGQSAAVAAAVPSGQTETGETPETPKPHRARRRVEAPPDPEPDPDNADQTAAGNAETDSGRKPALQTRAGKNCCRIARWDTLAAPVPAVSGEQAFVNAFATPPANGETVFSVTGRPKKHGWPRRFFGAIGRGMGKALGVR